MSGVITDGIRMTIRWYLDNRSWWEDILKGNYQNYYQQMYGHEVSKERAAKIVDPDAGLR